MRKYDRDYVIKALEEIRELINVIEELVERDEDDDED
jgi:hypothetical protein